jgi:prepilin-type N-terminal cleavage/methylation domain-containing protein
MLVHKKIAACYKEKAFTLAEILVAMLIFSMVMSGVIYGYVQANRIAEWCCMSLAATRYASGGAEQARAADWRPWDWPATNGPGTMDELPPTNYFQVDTMDIPSKGSPSSADYDFWVTNYISVSNYSINPPVRQIRADCVWKLPWSGQLMTNTVILLRGPDQ